MKRQVADRLFMTSISITLVVVSQIEDKSLSYRLVEAGGLWGQLCMWGLLLASLVALADTIVNDMLPDRYLLRTALGARRGFWMFMAITYAGIAFVVGRMSDGWSVSIFYTLFSFRCAGVSFLDLYYEGRAVARERSAEPTPVGGTIPAALSDD